jgi:SSS family solute:Na+ symporter
MFMVGILIATYALSRVVDRSIFKLGVWCFTGFAALFPVVVAALFWRRSTKWGAFASTLSVLVLWVYFVIHGWKDADYTIGGSGVMPVALMLVVSSVAMVVGSLLSPAPDPATLEKLFPPEPARGVAPASTGAVPT